MIISRSCNYHEVSPQFLQPFSIDSADFSYRDPTIPSPCSFHGVKICSVLLDIIFISSCRKLSSDLCHNSNNTQWWLGFPFFLRGETESVLRVISSSRNGSELKRPMAHKVCKRTKIHIRDYCKSQATKDWCVSMVAKKVAAQTYCHSWGFLFLRGQTQSFWPKL